MKKVYGGRIARTAGLVVTTSLATALVGYTDFDKPLKLAATMFLMAVGAFLAAMASDYDQGE